MPSSHRFLLKDSHPALLENAADDGGPQPQGRRYDGNYSALPGGIRIDEVALGMQLACVAITDDKPDTLKKVGRANPWQIQSMVKIMDGDAELAHAPLSEILATKFNLQVDHHLDISGFRAGYALDTQGYIAHNDDTIVLAYRCTTSGLDWLTNMSTSSSAWEHEDIELGHSGHFSCLAGLCCNGGDAAAPRVHTGFYNNFLASAPGIIQHIDPLLAPDQPPRKLYVVGHSLGAGIATMATIYFLLQHDWENLPHRLVTVTAGGPRACGTSMKQVVDERMQLLTSLDKAVICRVVRDKDCVPNVPPEIFGFQHLDKLVYLTKDDAILINPNLGRDHIVKKRTIQQLHQKFPHVPAFRAAVEADQAEEEEEAQAARGEEEEEEEVSGYDKHVQKVPRAFRDHMPDFYLAPILKLHAQYGGTNGGRASGGYNKDFSHTEAANSDDDGEGDPIIEIQEAKKSPRFFRRFRLPRNNNRKESSGRRK